MTKFTGGLRPSSSIKESRFRSWMTYTCSACRATTWCSVRPIMPASFDRLSSLPGLRQPHPRSRPSLIAIEAAADVFAGNENDRAQARQFVALLRQLAIGSDAAVLLILIQACPA